MIFENLPLAISLNFSPLRHREPFDFKIIIIVGDNAIYYAPCLSHIDTPGADGTSSSIYLKDMFKYRMVNWLYHNIKLVPYKKYENKSVLVNE